MGGRAGEKEAGMSLVQIMCLGTSDAAKPRQARQVQLRASPLLQVFTSWRQFTGLMQSEKAKIEARVQSQNARSPATEGKGPKATEKSRHGLGILPCCSASEAAFVPAHWDARDAMNDTAWITHWIQGRALSLYYSF